MNRSTTRFMLCMLIAAMACFQSQPVAVAGPIYQPVSVSTNMGTLLGNINNTRNQSGLVPGYTSGSTDFFNYINTSSVAGFNIGSHRWSSIGGVTTGNVIYDLGSVYPIDSLAFWNWGGSDPINVKDFSLYSDDNPTFSSPTFLGSYTASAGPFTVQTFKFAETNERYYRLSITSNNGHASVTGFNEVAFGVIPEPSTFVVGGIAIVSLLVAVRRRKVVA